MINLSTEFRIIELYMIMNLNESQLIIHIKAESAKHVAVMIFFGEFTFQTHSPLMGDEKRIYE